MFQELDHSAPTDTPLIELKKRADAAIPSSCIALQGFALNNPKKAGRFPPAVTNFLATLFIEGEQDSSCKASVKV